MPASDYYSLRPGQTKRSFVMTAITVVGGVKHWNFIEYGRDRPPFVARPNVQITAPKDGANFDQGATVTYTALVNDPVWGSLPASALVWTEDGNLIGNGPQVTHTESVAGKHTITLTATNGDNKAASQSITINVQAPPPAGAPIPSITGPADSSSFCAKWQDAQAKRYEPVSFQATATDPNSPPQALTYSWTDSVNGGAATQVSTDLSPTLNLYYVDPGGLRDTTHDLTLTVTNTSGKSGSKMIRVYIRSSCID